MTTRGSRQRASIATRDDASELGPQRLAIGRVRLRSVARVGFSIGWVISLLPSLITSAVVAWILHGIWATLDGWSPWSPWSRGTSVLGVQLPTPEFRPREALRLDGLYQKLEPIGHHPFVGAALGTLALTIVGGLIFAVLLIIAGLAYNLFATVTGGIEFEVNERRPRRTSARAGTPAARRRDDDDWDDADLRW